MSDSWKLDDFQPVPLDDTQPAKPARGPAPLKRKPPPEPPRKQRPAARQRRRRRRVGRRLAKPMLTLVVLLLLYFLLPWQHRVLILGIDRVPEGTTLGRSDTMILTAIDPWPGEVKMLSIPRDLWVAIPGYGESRINAAHYFAEGDQPGSGPQAAIETVKSNFEGRVNSYVRIRLEGFAGVIDALGGISLELAEPAAGYEAGSHELDGTQALAFVRDRTGDDFFRMQNGQLFVQAMLRKLINPLTWLRIPAALVAVAETIDTDVPAWLWPRMGLALVRALPDGFETRSLDRTMVNPWTTVDGAQVLLPNWPVILTLTDELF